MNNVHVVLTSRVTQVKLLIHNFTFNVYKNGVTISLQAFHLNYPQSLFNWPTNQSYPGCTGPQNIIFGEIGAGFYIDLKRQTMW